MTEVLHLPVHPVPPDALDRARGFLRRVQLDDNLFTDHLGRITTALLRPGHHSERAGGLANISRQFTQGSMYAGVSRLSLSMNLTHKSLYLCDIRLFTGIDELGIAVFMIDARPGSLTLDTTALALVPLYALARCIDAAVTCTLTCSRWRDPLPSTTTRSPLSAAAGSAHMHERIQTEALGQARELRRLLGDTEKQTVAQIHDLIKPLHRRALRSATPDRADLVRVARAWPLLAPYGRLALDVRQQRTNLTVTETRVGACRLQGARWDEPEPGIAINRVSLSVKRCEM